MIICVTGERTLTTKNRRTVQRKPDGGKENCIMTNATAERVPQSQNRNKFKVAKKENKIMTIENKITVSETAQTNSIHTTSEEIQAFGFIQGVLSLKIDPARIAMRDARTYCAILLDDNNRKTLCRLYLESAKKKIEFPKLEQAIELQGVADLKKARTLLFKTLALLENKAEQVEQPQTQTEQTQELVYAGRFPMSYLQN